MAREKTSADPESRKALTKLLKDECPIAAQVKKGEADSCGYVSFNAGCAGCSYAWEVVADFALELMGTRRAAVKREKDKVKELKAENKVLKAFVKTTAATVGGLAAELHINSLEILGDGESKEKKDHGEKRTSAM
jgi:hypothetical protein